VPRRNPPRRNPPRRAPGMAGAAALAVLAAACGGGGHSTPQGAASPSSPAAASSPTAASPAPSGPATGIVSYPVRVGSYRLVNKADRPVTATTKDTRFPQSFSFAATARDGYYLPGHQRHQVVYLIAGRLAQGVTPAAAIAGYLGSFSGQELHLTTEPAGALGGAVKCWAAGGITFCMWADNGTYGVFDYQPPLGLDTALIHHLAGVVPRFRAAMERG
jgi:hypothetical protein